MPVAERLGARETVTLYHGTTSAAATKILDEGWRPLDLKEMVGAVADELGEDRGAVWSDLDTWHRFITLDHRHGYASFATSHRKAGGWAQRAPEARWETLWAVWRIRHPAEAEYWTQNPNGHRWVFEQMLNQAPAVVTVEVPRSHPMRSGGFGEGHAVRDEHFDPWLLARLPEIRVDMPVPAGFIVAVDPIYRRVPRHLAPVLLGITNDEFNVRNARGEYPNCVYDPENHEGPWWPWDTFKPMVELRSA